MLSTSFHNIYRCSKNDFWKVETATKLASKESLPIDEQMVVTEHANEVTKMPIQELLAWRIIMTCEKLFWNPIH